MSNKLSYEDYYHQTSEIKSHIQSLKTGEFKDHEQTKLKVSELNKELVRLESKYRYQGLI
ncbi:hypothetical protein E2605_09480 [Dysgonomonas capnocytophagoides]|uniref:Uncharacterized protein n=1 Tax=Dysgonomonas capnocytophagoides TaxID=45254 RepID=A0A4Y8L4G7_9BACT|nr:hypothetical protein [Dysgonomonas capnocytophagoides]TFD96392.1 hypothetical protein E2605_09480 [Dysgonomonas capnocytophagoides]